MTESLYQAIFRAAEALEVPVVLLALAALAWVLVEVGAYVAEVAQRWGRNREVIQRASLEARRLIADGERDQAADSLDAVGWSVQMAEVLRTMPEVAGRPGADSVLGKLLADFEFGRERRLARTRLLVRFGPALGLMGTLIPLSPALEGLANGDVTTLAENLRLAFSVTVLGLLVGAAAYAVSLLRDRMYGQDYSDLEFVAAILTSPDAPELDGLDGAAAAPVLDKPSRQALKAERRALKAQQRAEQAEQKAQAARERAGQLPPGATEVPVESETQPQSAPDVPVEPETRPLFVTDLEAGAGSTTETRTRSETDSQSGSETGSEAGRPAP